MEDSPFVERIVKEVTSGRERHEMRGMSIEKRWAPEREAGRNMDEEYEEPFPEVLGWSWTKWLNLRAGLSKGGRIL